MVDQAEDIAAARIARLASRPLFNPLVQDIVDALVAMGGKALRDAVIAKVARNRGAALPSEALRRELIAAFHINCDAAARSNMPAMLFHPSGSAQHWAISAEAIPLFQWAHTRSAAKRARSLL